MNQRWPEVCCIFIDFSAAFSSVHRESLWNYHRLDHESAFIISKDLSIQDMTTLMTSRFQLTVVKLVRLTCTM